MFMLLSFLPAYLSFLTSPVPFSAFAVIHSYNLGLWHILADPQSLPSSSCLPLELLCPPRMQQGLPWWQPNQGAWALPEGQRGH